ncbi:hypothetical protein MATL_G00209160 [Megalops atlanticus]|uniref:Large ribosomal subunit protein mL64 n=1 Tax=Megalops atlanticus TaxID=7932 RepID=A0A9D3PJB1_MEGAT|nr:hypothetical protein MATL_G00209160 [Megalops atlanticus]
MAASMLCGRSERLRGLLRGISVLKTLISSTTQCGPLLQIVYYNPKPLRLNFKDPYIPDKESKKTPEWQKTIKYDRKLFGRYGFASGVDPEQLWPSSEELKEMITEEKEWQPSLEEMLTNIRAKEQERAKKLQSREKLIAANMAKMPQMVAEWRRESRDIKRKQKEEKARRERLLAEARERFGYVLDPRSPKFLDMVKEIEKEEKKKRKLLKRQKKAEESAAPAPNAPAPGATS